MMIKDNKVFVGEYVIVFKGMDVDKDIVEYISNIVESEKRVDASLHNYDRNRNFSIILDNHNIIVQKYQ